VRRRGRPSLSQSGQRLIIRPSHSTSGGTCSSPMRRLGQRLVTRTSSVFRPGFKRPVTLRRNGGFTIRECASVQPNLREVLDLTQVEKEVASTPEEILRAFTVVR